MLEVVMSKQVDIYIVIAASIFGAVLGVVLAKIFSGESQSEGNGTSITSTEIPNGLIITKDSYNKRFNATHYSISPNYDMPKFKFIQLLDRLARNADSQKRKLSNG